MDFFSIFVVIVLVVIVFASFKYPTAFYLQTHGRKEGKISRAICYMSAIIFSFLGIFSSAELASFAMSFYIEVTTYVRIICYAIAFMVEVIGNLLYIKIKYGGFSELSEVQIVYADDDDDDYDEYDEEYDEEDNEEISEPKNNVISIEDYKRRKGK